MLHDNTFITDTQMNLRKRLQNPITDQTRSNAVCWQLDPCRHMLHKVGTVSSLDIDGRALFHKIISAICQQLSCYPNLWAVALQQHTALSYRWALILYWDWWTETWVTTITDIHCTCFTRVNFSAGTAQNSAENGAATWRTQTSCVYRVAQKNWHHFLCAATLPNVNRFSKLFHCQNQEKHCNNTNTKNLTTPQVCRYTTLWNVSKQQLKTRRLL